jgi:membrane protease subunit HflC
VKLWALVILVAVGLFVLLVLGGSLYVVDETQQVIITEFGKPVGEPVVTPGLKFKTPFIQKAHYFDKRFLEWDGDSNQLPTKDKRFIHVDAYARWRITDPLKFFQRLFDERGAQSRLDDILDGETRNTIAKHDLIEVVRSTNREFAISEELGEEEAAEQSQEKIEFGRQVLAAEVLRAAQGRTSDLGIEILDFRFKRINYVEQVRVEVYARMVSERKRIAERFRSEGAGESARINGERERELKAITSEAYRESQQIMGRADAAAAEIYAKAYDRDAEFYRFTRTMEVYGDVLSKDTTLVLGTDGDLLRYLGQAK